MFHSKRSVGFGLGTWLWRDLHFGLQCSAGKNFSDLTQKVVASFQHKCGRKFFRSCLCKCRGETGLPKSISLRFVLLRIRFGAPNPVSGPEFGFRTPIHSQGNIIIPQVFCIGFLLLPPILLVFHCFIFLRFSIWSQNPNPVSGPESTVKETSSHLKFISLCLPLFSLPNFLASKNLFEHSWLILEEVSFEVFSDKVMASF